MNYLNFSEIIWIHFPKKQKQKDFIMVIGSDLSRFLSRDRIVKFYPKDNLLVGSVSKIFIL